MLTRTFTGSSAIDFAVACREVVAAAVGGRSPARLLDAAGEVVFEVDDCGRTRERVAVVEEALPANESNDGWFRTEAAFVVVHLGRVFSIVVGGVLAVAPLESLPEGAQAVPMDEVGALQLAAAELIEIFCQGGQ